ncbi:MULTISPECIES: hypothetical protein [unclassified Burkholderia]|uniref:hypothetical protein n=1 Tax=unclassified Burkholderia TaxID=2613784 RepID=UPI00158EB64E|nr:MULTISPECIES: hypothetical protein [unclassified Burkholderia]
MLQEDRRPRIHTRRLFFARHVALVLADGRPAAGVDVVLAETVRGDGAMSDRRRVGGQVTVTMRFGPHAPGRGRKCLSRISEATGTPDELF